ncbi:hypothetical protein CASFOL_002254 [Castilleja foliolosa]|uniref:SBP-type domain-containing protein n=1 Tax=Castilleja foliolosa TaxID=1961234 RepID=A0ABD3EDR9_9LAMI
MKNMMSSYLKIKKLVEDEDEDEEEEEMFVETQMKRKRQSLGEGVSGADKTPAAGRVAAAAPFCVVERCQADLSGFKKYYQKHRVCVVHSKAPLVLVDGFSQRFCQQCSRFHDVSEFDDTKRSCRRRLAGHNERRRKSWIESQKCPTRLRIKLLNQGSSENQDLDIH